MPASTIQLCGAEKALFRALKKKHDAPKYGLIYHSSLVGRATAKVQVRVSIELCYKKSLILWPIFQISYHITSKVYSYYFFTCLLEFISLLFVLNSRNPVVPDLQYSLNGSVRH